MPRVTSRQLVRLRLRALGLHPPGAHARRPVEVVRHHLAMQGQDWGASQWAVGSRLKGATRADVLAAYDNGELVRSWPMRGTVHVVASEDLPWMLDLMGVRALSGVKRRWEMLGIDEAFLEKARDVATTLLKGGKRALREEFTRACVESGLDLDGQRAYHAVWYLAQTGTLVQGPTRDGEQQLVLLDGWIRKPKKLSRDAALAELGRRYFTARGPATVDDLMHWSGLNKGDCRRAIEAAGDVLATVERDGETLHATREQLESEAHDDTAYDRRMLALAAFDEHLLGYKRRDDVLDPEHADKVDPRRNGVFRWTLVSGGRVVATWSRTKRAKHVKVEIAPLTSLSVAQEKAAKAAIAEWGRFAGLETRVERS